MSRKSFYLYLQISCPHLRLCLPLSLSVYQCMYLHVFCLCISPPVCLSSLSNTPSLCPSSRSPSLSPAPSLTPPHPPLPPLSLPRSATFGVRNASTRGRWMCASIASGRGQNRSSTERPTATGSWTGFRPLSTPVRADAFATCQVCAINLSGTVGSIACSGRRYDPRLHR